MIAHSPSPDEIQLLRDARTRAQKLLASLIAQRDDLLAAPPRIAPDKLELGKLAFEKAIDSARKTLDNMDQALRLPHESADEQAAESADEQADESVDK